MSSGNYEFTADQNTTLKSLSHKMGWVGAFLVVAGLFNVLVVLLLLSVIYQDRIPPNVMEQLTPEVREQLRQQASQLPPLNQLWGIVISTAIGGLIYLCLGGWTRSAASSFVKITQTQNRDIPLLMEGLGALGRMYGLLYTLLMLALLAILVGVGLTLWQQYQHMMP
jgi:tetrahydromethanopterin S-methyltransferase subunit B